VKKLASTSLREVVLQLPKKGASAGKTTRLFKEGEKRGIRRMLYPLQRRTQASTGAVGRSSKIGYSKGDQRKGKGGGSQEARDHLFSHQVWHPEGEEGGEGGKPLQKKCKG